MKTTTTTAAVEFIFTAAEHSRRAHTYSYQQDSGMAKAQAWKVVVGVTIGGIIAGLPLLNKKVYQREQEVALMRDQRYDVDVKSEARDSRLKR